MNRSGEGITSGGSLPVFRVYHSTAWNFTRFHKLHRFKTTSKEPQKKCKHLHFEHLPHPRAPSYAKARFGTPRCRTPPVQRANVRWRVVPIPSVRRALGDLGVGGWPQQACCTWFALVPTEKINVFCFHLQSSSIIFIIPNTINTHPPLCPGGGWGGKNWQISKREGVTPPEIFLG